MEEKLIYVTEICSKPLLERSLKEEEVVRKFTKDMKIFKEVCHETCCKYLYYECVPKDSYVFRAGNDSDKFYIIIAGTVSIEVLGVNNTIKPVCELKDGDYFGELGLQNSQPRAASAKCLVDTHFFYLLKNDYLKVIDKSLSKKRNALTIFLREIPAFRFLTYAGVKKLTYNLKEIVLTKNNTLYTEGTTDWNVYIIREGEFSLFKTLQVTKRVGLHNKVKSFCKKVLILGVGEVFGEFEAYNSKKRDFTCTCTSERGSVLAMNIDEFCQRINKEEILQLVNAQSKQKHEEMLKRFKIWLDIEEDKSYQHARNTSMSIRHLNSSSGNTRKHRLSYSKPGIIYDISNPRFSTDKKMILSRYIKFPNSKSTKSSLEASGFKKRYNRVRLKKMIL